MSDPGRGGRGGTEHSQDIRKYDAEFYASVEEPVCLAPETG